MELVAWMVAMKAEGWGRTRASKLARAWEEASAREWAVERARTKDVLKVQAMARGWELEAVAMKGGVLV